MSEPTNLITLKSDLNDVCRLCLNVSSENNLINSYIDCIECIVSCASIEIYINDGLPQKLCLACIKKIKLLINFIKRTKDSDIILRSYYKDTVKVKNDSNSMAQTPKATVESKADKLLVRKTLKYKAPSNCHVCQKAFSCNAQLTRHLKTHTGIKSFICELCGKSYVESGSLHKHFIAKHSGRQKPYKCTECEQSFNLNSTLIRHKRTHTGEKPFKCDTCNKCYPSKSYLNKHKKIHNDTRQRTFVCEKCSKAFMEKEGLKAHLAIHCDQKTFQCNFCDKSFSTNGSRKSHVKYIHTKEKNFMCENCAKTFTTKSDLNEHMKVHTGEGKLPTHQCTMCPKKLTSTNNLKFHVKAEHTGERSFVCEFCPKAFITRQALKIHRRYHTGERPYGCCFCEKKFVTNEGRKIHERVHTGERPYVCSACGAAFKQSSTLKTHMKNH